MMQNKKVRTEMYKKKKRATKTSKIIHTSHTKQHDTFSVKNPI